MRTVTRQKFYVFFISLTLVTGMAGLGCDSTTGAEGPQGEEGPEGPAGLIGPAGEDGSQMYADDGEPGDDVGTTGDYYLNQNTGALYGPKDSGGWGSPGIVLMGEDGQDGQDGQDGSQIHSGTGAPDASLGAEGDFYLDKDSYELYGPKTSDGWGTPLNLKGADGNANVTRYIWGLEVSFSTANPDKYFMLTDVENENDMQSSVWLAYLGKEVERDFRPGIETTFTYYAVPGYGQNSDSWYDKFHYYDPTREAVQVEIHLKEGSGEVYDQIEFIRIEANNSENLKRKGTIIPDHLDVSDYEAVAEYYGFQNK